MRPEVGRAHVAAGPVVGQFKLTHYRGATLLDRQGEVCAYGAPSRAWPEGAQLEVHERGAAVVAPGLAEYPPCGSALS